MPADLNRDPPEGHHTITRHKPPSQINCPFVVTIFLG
jgi:hypothetical protein